MRGFLKPALPVALLCGLMAMAACQPAADSGGSPPAESSAESAIYFPPAEGDWQRVDPAEVGYSAAGLEAALDYAREQRSSGVVVLYRGRVMAERYWEVPEQEGSRWHNVLPGTTDDGRTIEDVASVQKSVLSFLAGVARGRGLVDFETAVSEVLGEGWSKADADAEAGVLVRHLMSMSSGLETDRTYEVPAGEKWMYNTNVYSRLVQVLEAASGLEVNEYTSQWLTSRVGMADSQWGPRPWLQAGQDANAIGFQTTARDLARFGVLMLAGGSWNGEDLLGDPLYLEQALSPSQEMNPAYGLLWWLNGWPLQRSLGGDDTEATTVVPSAPSDLYAAQGALGRKLYVVPSLGLVVTRLGDAPEAAFNDELWKRLMAARGPPITHSNLR